MPNSWAMGFWPSFTMDSKACRMLKPAFSELLMRERASSSCALNFSSRRCFSTRRMSRGICRAPRPPARPKMKPAAMPPGEEKSPSTAMKNMNTATAAM